MKIAIEFEVTRTYERVVELEDALEAVATDAVGAWEQATTAKLLMLLNEAKLEEGEALEPMTGSVYVGGEQMSELLWADGHIEVDSTETRVVSVRKVEDA